MTDWDQVEETERLWEALDERDEKLRAIKTITDRVWDTLRPIYAADLVEKNLWAISTVYANAMDDIEAVLRA
jgi:alpha-amylase/alpha-mannosidase (GH57 family)